MVSTDVFSLTVKQRGEKGRQGPKLQSKYHPIPTASPPSPGVKPRGCMSLLLKCAQTLLLFYLLSQQGFER